MGDHYELSMQRGLYYTSVIQLWRQWAVIDVHFNNYKCVLHPNTQTEFGKSDFSSVDHGMHMFLTIHH